MLKFFLFLVLIQFEFSHASEANDYQNEALQIQLKKSPDPIYVCPAESETIISKLKKLAKNHYESAYCLFEKDFETGQKELCKFELKPIFAICTNHEDKPIRCGSGSNQFLHYFGYYFCGGTPDLEEIEGIKKSQHYKNYIRSLKKNHVAHYVYNVCYDTSTEKTIWTSHSVLKPSFFLNPSLKEESYQANEISTDPFFMNPERFLKIKKRYEAELDNRRIDADLHMFPYPIVPSSHFFTVLWKKTTNHFINMAPLSKRLKTLMTVINDGIKTADFNQFKSNKKKLLIYTAVKGIHKPGLLSRLLNYDSFETFKGNIWYKFVYNSASKEGVMIYIHNTLEKKVGKKCPEMKEIECNFVSWATSISPEQASHYIDLQYAYCCKVDSKETQEIFSEHFEIKAVLNINQLIKNKTDDEQ